MTLSTLLDDTLHALARSWLLRGLAYGVASVIVMAIIVAILLAATIVLHRFFKRHPVIRRVRKFFVYLLTLCGVLALVLAGILGLFLPIIPGIALILAGLLLLRKYHRFAWLEERITRMKERLRREKRKEKKASDASAKSGKP